MKMCGGPFQILHEYNASLHVQMIKAVLPYRIVFLRLPGVPPLRHFEGGIFQCKQNAKTREHMFSNPALCGILSFEPTRDRMEWSKMVKFFDEGGLSNAIKRCDRAIH
jgi:hypothetical protein